MNIKEQVAAFAASDPELRFYDAAVPMPDDAPPMPDGCLGVLTKTYFTDGAGDRAVIADERALIEEQLRLCMVPVAEMLTVIVGAMDQSAARLAAGEGLTIISRN